MKQVLSDFSQLRREMFATEAPGKALTSEGSQTPGATRDEDVLAYFSRPAGNLRHKSCRRSAVGTSSADGAVARSSSETDVATALRAELQEAVSARREAEALLDDSKRKGAEASAMLADAQKELARLQGECGRLMGELRKAGNAASGCEDRSPLPVPMRENSGVGVLARPAALAEAFPGELREMLISVLSDARDAARQGARERRAAVLDAVLSVNRPTGELERRRAELKQIMKDAGYYTDPRALEGLGFKLVSGRTHWKIEYAGVRMPIAKTPSDYRANLNMATDVANRCF